MKLSNKIEACGLSPIRKFYPFAHKAEKRGLKIHHLNIGQPDIETPSAYFEAISAYRAEVLSYAPSGGVIALIEAIQNYYARLGVPYAPEDILITSGGSEALSMAMLCILNEGDEVLVPEPFYPNYRTFIRMAGGEIRPIPTTPEDGYHYADRSRIEPLINEKTRALLITNPGNPTGAVLTQKEIRLLGDIAKEHDLYLICDEVYREFIYDGGALTTAATLQDLAENLIIVDSVSKRFSACGARVGALLSRNEALMEGAMKLAQSRLSVATLDQVGAAALYRTKPSYFRAVRSEYQRRRDVCYEKLREIPGILVSKPQGAFYMMAKLPVEDTEAFQMFLLKNFDYEGETVMFAPGGGFYATEGAGRSEVRIAYVHEISELERSLEVLKKGLETYNQKP